MAFRMGFVIGLQLVPAGLSPCKVKQLDQRTWNDECVVKVQAARFWLIAVRGRLYMLLSRHALLQAVSVEVQISDSQVC